MTDEIKIETKTETCNCICKSEGFRNFLVVATGTFVGAFCALSLFAALNKPPMPYPMHCAHMRPYIAQPHHFAKHHKGQKHHFHKKMEHRNFDKQAPINANIPQK